MPSQKCQTLGDELIFSLSKCLGTWQTPANSNCISVGDALTFQRSSVARAKISSFARIYTERRHAKKLMSHTLLFCESYTERKPSLVKPWEAQISPPRTDSPTPTQATTSSPYGHHCTAAATASSTPTTPPPGASPPTAPLPPGASTPTAPPPLGVSQPTVPRPLGASSTTELRPQVLPHNPCYCPHRLP